MNKSKKSKMINKRIRKSKRYERCVLSVKKRQPSRCKKSNWKGPGCYNPFAVCFNVIKKSKKYKRKSKSRRKSRK